MLFRGTLVERATEAVLRREVGVAEYAAITPHVDWSAVAQAHVNRAAAQLGRGRKFHRTAAECRLRWMNEDSPCITTGPWSEAEELQLRAVAERRGTQDWEAIARDLARAMRDGASLGEPAATLAEPAASLTKPAASLAEPAASLAEPAASLVKPASSLAEPAAILAEPAAIVGYASPAAEAGAEAGLERTSQHPLPIPHSSPPLGAELMPIEAGAGAGLGTETVTGTDAEVASQEPLSFPPFAHFFEPEPVPGAEAEEEVWPRRSALACLVAYQQWWNPGIVRKEWSPEEDRQLVEVVKRVGENNWHLAAQAMSGRSMQQCSTR